MIRQIIGALWPPLAVTALMFIVVPHWVLYAMHPVAFALFILCSGAEGWLTLDALREAKGTEGHPLAGFFIRRLGLIPGIVLPKLAQIGAVWLVAFYPGGWPVSYVAAAIFAGVLINNARIALRTS